MGASAEIMTDHNLSSSKKNIHHVPRLVMPLKEIRLMNSLPRIETHRSKLVHSNPI